MTLQAFLLTLTLASSTQAFKILVLYPTPSFSHQRSILALTEKLVQEGHELFVVSPNRVPELNNENYTYVDVSFAHDFMHDEKNEDAVSFQKQPSVWEIWRSTFAQLKPMHLLVIDQEFLSEPFLQFQRRVKAEKINFDVIIIESVFMPYTCAMTRILAENTPIIAMSTSSTDFYFEDFLGSIRHHSYVPTMFFPFTNKMSLWQKTVNWLVGMPSKAFLAYIIEIFARQFYRENHDAEHLVDGCWANLSLSLVTSNPLYYYPRLLAPNVVEVGPIHIKSPEKLPKYLQDWLDGAEKGVIYFSLGSTVKLETLPEEAQLNFLKVFGELPPGYRALCKWGPGGKIPGQSDNILAQKWLPQESVLAHPKVKLFITQGGLQSFQEAVHYGVPMVGVPWLGDQECNVAKIEDAQIGVRLPSGDLSYQKIKSAVEAVLYDERYRKNMNKISAVSKDFTAQSLDKAVFWVEHVARHGGASHLRPSTADTTYFQFFCLDIISVILALSFVILYITYSMCKCLVFHAFKKPNLKIK